MHPAAGTPPRIGPHVALGLLAGAMACLWSPGLLPPSALITAILVGTMLWWRLPKLAWAGAALIGFGWAGLTAQQALSVRIPAELEGRTLQVSGVVDELPRTDPRAVRFTLRVDTASDIAEPLRGRRLRLSWFAAPGAAPRVVGAGTRWRLKVSLKRPHGLRNSGVLDSERGMFIARIAATGSVRGGQPEDEAPAGLEATRERIATRIAAIHHPSSRFVRALAIGDTRALTDDDWRILRADGLTHLIAISGSHVALAALLGAGLAWGLWWLVPALGYLVPKRTAMALAGVIVAIWYTALAGSEVPTLRTLLMMASVGGAVMLRRRIGVLHALSVAAIAITVVDPLNLLRPGFWLSFGGVAWLAWCLRDDARSRWREFLSAQGVATVGLLPLSMLFFAQASWIAPVANVIAVPFWGFVIVPLALLGVVLDGLHAGAGELVWGCAARLFEAAWPVFQHLSRLEIAQSILPEPAWFALPLALLGAFWLLLPRAVPGKPLALALWLPMFTPLHAVPTAGAASIEIIDVGQGQAILVQTARHALLYDAGPATPEGYDAGENTVLPALAALDVKRLDLLMLSHADNDHAGGAAAVRAGIPVTGTQAPFDAGIEGASPCAMGDRWLWDDVQFEVLWPRPNTPYQGNASSCVIRVTAHGRSVLLTGDIPKDVEAELVAADPQRVAADVVLMPHHGSAGSSSWPFIRATGARWAIASAGYRNRYHHPSAPALRRWDAAGATIVATPVEGAVRIALGNPEGVSVTPERSRRRRLWDAAR